ncbi:MAG: undecaprenyl-diphosphatase UppP [Anaerolineae bacterium]|nr:undecaprenyl-diphosphatase UppP [Anaerolineae bacterium]
MTPWQAILLGILQGLTEFLPVSSSGHLVIIPHILGWPDPGIFMDAMLHTGTLVAIVLYFLEDIARLVKAAVTSLRNRTLADPDARLAWGLAIGTLPGAIIGFLLEDWFARLFGNPSAAAMFLLGTAFLLILSEYIGKKNRPITSISWFEALIIGIAQALAIAPGLSRSGLTISAGLMLGFRREDAARYSFLLAIPIMLGVTGYNLLKLVTGHAVYASLGLVALGTFCAVLAGYLAITGLLALVRRSSLWPFAVYCIVLSALVLLGIIG